MQQKFYVVRIVRDRDDQGSQTRGIFKNFEAATRYALSMLKREAVGTEAYVDIAKVGEKI